MAAPSLRSGAVANNPHALNIIIKEIEIKSKWPDARGKPFGTKSKTRMGFGM